MIEEKNNVDIAEETYISLCAGVGGLDLGLRIALPDARCVCYVEREAFCIAHLVDKMEAGWLDTAPVWTDIKTFDGKPWRGKVRGLIGGYPCQPFSVAGQRKGEQDERHLWPEIKRLICEIRPSWCFFENVAGHLRLGFDKVLCDLAKIGYDVIWTVIAAGDVGATHQRKRLFILAFSGAEGLSCKQANKTNSQNNTGKSSRTKLAHSRQWLKRQCRHTKQKAFRGEANKTKWLSERNQTCRPNGDMGNTGKLGLPRQHGRRSGQKFKNGYIPLWPPTPSNRKAWTEILKENPLLEPAICGMADGAASRVDRLRALGNAVVPIQAAVAFCTLVDFARRQIDKQAKKCGKMD